MATLDNKLITDVKNDVKGAQENVIEDATLQGLKEIKDKFQYDDEYLSTLYKAEFKHFLTSKNFETINANEIVQLNNIKLNIIKKALEKNKEQAQNPNRVTRKIIYPACNIDQDIAKNGKVANLIKGVIDELMAIPDLVVMIIKNPIEF